MIDAKKGHTLVLADNIFIWMNAKIVGGIVVAGGAIVSTSVGFAHDVANDVS